jgi:hypothetical protein
MAFPTQPILDNFNRSTGIGANWTTDPVNAVVIDGTNTKLTTAINDYCGGIWTAQKFNGDVEVYITHSTTGTTETDISVRQSLTDPVGGYVYDIRGTGADTVEFYRIDLGVVYTQLGATVHQTVSNGDSVGFVRNNSTGQVIGCYKSGAGSWVVLITCADSTFTGSVYLGVTPSSTTMLFDDFGGGAELEPKDDIKTFPKFFMRQPLTQGRLL